MCKNGERGLTDEEGRVFLKVSGTDTYDFQLKVSAHDDLLGVQFEDYDWALDFSSELDGLACSDEIPVLFEELQEFYRVFVHSLEFDEVDSIVDVPDVDGRILSALCRCGYLVEFGYFDDGDGLGVSFVVLLRAEFGEEDDHDLAHRVNDALITPFLPLHTHKLYVLAAYLHSERPLELQVQHLLLACQSLLD